MNIDVNISKYMKSDAGRIVAVEYSAVLTHPDYVGVSSHTAGIVVSNLDADATIQDMERFVSLLISGDTNLLSVHLSDLNFKRTLADAVPYSTAPQLTPEELRAQMPPLTPRQFRDALIDADIMPDQVTAAIGQIPDVKHRAKALNAWEYPTQFTRTDPLIDQIGAMFGLSPDDIDVLWLGAE